MIAGVSIALLARLTLMPRLVKVAKPIVNLNRKQQPDAEKIVHQIFLEDLSDKKTFFCRCWRSNKVRTLVHKSFLHRTNVKNELIIKKILLIKLFFQ